MNKLIAIVSLTVVASLVASAQTVFNNNDFFLEKQIEALTPSNADETTLLDAQTKVFSDFCISARDQVIGDMKQRLEANKNNRVSDRPTLIRKICENVEKYIEQTKESFRLARDDLAAKNSSIAAYELENVNCVTTQRLFTMKKVCELSPTDPAAFIQAIFAVQVPNIQ